MKVEGYKAIDDEAYKVGDKVVVPGGRRATIMRIRQAGNIPPDGATVHDVMVEGSRATDPMECYTADRIRPELERE